MGFDVLLSHKSMDKPTVRELGQRLKARDVRVWLERQPEDLGAQCNFAETHFTTRRYCEAENQLASLIECGNSLVPAG